MYHQISPTERALKAIVRAEMPAVLFAEDLAVQFRLDVDAAAQALRNGQFGACFYVSGRAAVLREDLKRTMQELASRLRPGDREVLGGTSKGDSPSDGGGQS